MLSGEDLALKGGEAAAGEPEDPQAHLLRNRSEKEVRPPALHWPFRVPVYLHQHGFCG
jgi:hypothetical protein